MMMMYMRVYMYFIICSAKFALHAARAVFNTTDSVHTHDALCNTHHARVTQHAGAMRMKLRIKVLFRTRKLNTCRGNERRPMQAPKFG